MDRNLRADRLSSSNCSSLRSPVTPLHTAVALSLLAGIATSAAAIDRSWATGSTSWHTPSHWTPLGVPTAADIVRIGNLPVAHGQTVFAHANAAAASLILTNDAGYQNEGHFTNIGASTYIGAGARIYLTDAGVGSDFFTTTLVLEGEGARFLLNDAGLRVNATTTIGVDSFIRLLSSEWRTSGNGATLINNGWLLAGPGASFAIQESTGRYDLDGTTGNGQVAVSGDTQASLALYGTGLTDPFDGEIQLGQYGRLYMILDEGWEAAPGSLIEVVSGAAADNEHALLSNIGQGFLLNAEVEVINIFGRADLTIAGTTTVGTHANVVLDDDAYLNFTGHTLVTGGTFETLNDSLQAGSVTFDGATEWRGTATIVGSARQNGPATVTAAAGATINAVTFDMDGLNNTTAWTIGGPLVINTVNMNALSQPRFDGSMTISGGVTARLTLNLDHPADAWTMRGDLSLGGTSPFTSIRLAGTPVVIAGDLEVTTGRAMITADATFSGDAAPGLATVTIAPPAAELRLGGASLVEAGVVFVGDGWLGVNSGGSLTLEDGVNLANIGLTSNGSVSITPGVGVVSVHRFTQSSTGILRVSLGGYAQGYEHDLLIVSGDQATLAGSLRIDLATIEAAQFAPAIGDTFTILTSLGGIVGTFDLVPTTQGNGQRYHWSVDYQPNAVLVELVDVSPIPPCLGDFNSDGLLDFADVQLFLNAFSAHSPAADVNFDGLFEFADVQQFLAAFSAGCDGE
jgi:hypothetical protein